MTGEGERRALNRRVAKNAINAGIPIVLVSDDKAPLWPAYQRLDQGIMPAEKAEIEAEAVAKGKAPPAHVGSTKDLEVLRAMFRKFPDALPAACAGLAGLIVIDVDTKRDGVNKLEAWLAEHGHALPERTPVTLTQSGGRHYVFRDPHGLGNRAGSLATLGCDVRGRGGVFVLPGAVRMNGARYRQASADLGLLFAFAAGEVPELPEFFKTAIQAGETNSTIVTDAETAALVARLRTAELPEALDASRFVSDDKSGDKSAWRLTLANRMIAKGHTVEEYLATLREAEHAGVFVGDTVPDEGEYGLRNVARDWGQAKRRHAENVADAARIEAAADECFKLDKPEVAMASIETAVAAGDYPEDECGRYVEALDNAGATLATIQAAQDACRRLLDDMTCGIDLAPALAALKGKVTDVEADAPRTGRGYKAESALFAEIELTAWTIDEILPERGIGFIVGASHTGKTFACLDMMGHLAQGRDWFGRKVYEPTCSLYIGGEDVEEIPGRIKAWTQRNGSTRDRLGVMDAPPNLAADPKAIKKVVQVVKHLKEDTGLRCGLIVLDTVSSLAAGMKEVSDEVNVLTALMRSIGKSTGAAVLGVHHPKKGDDSGEGRGSGSFYNNATFEFRLIKKKGARRGSFQVHKNKFAALDTAGMSFQLDPETIFYVDKDGETINTNRHGKTVSTLVFRQADACDFPAVADDEGDEAEGAAPEAGEPTQALRGQDRVLAAAKRAIAAHGCPVKRAAIAAEIEADGGAPLSGNSLGPLVARLVEEGALVSGGRQRYGVP